MASGNTKTEALLNILGHGGTGDEYRGSGNTKTQNYILDAIDRINSLDPGGGGSDFNQLTNRPKYNGTAMTGDTDVTDEIVFLELAISDVSHIADGYIDFTSSMTISEIHTEFTNGKTVVARITIPTSVGVFSSGTYYFLPSFESSSWYFASGSAYNSTTSEWLNFTYIQGSTTSRLYFKSDSGSGSGGDAFTELTSADYNYPTDNPDGIYWGMLEPGYYKWEVQSGSSPLRFYLSGNSSTLWYSGSFYVGVKTSPYGTSPTKYMLALGNNGYYYRSGTTQIDILTSNDILQSTGTSTTDVMSQKAVTDAIAALETRIAALEGN